LSGELENSEGVRLEEVSDENNVVHERKVNKHETKALGGECSTVVHNKLPTKFKDPDSFSIPCLIGNIIITRALCNLGSSACMMPYSIFKRLDLG